MKTEKLTILAIDDNQDNLIALQVVLRDILPEASLLTALNGRQGIELARIEDPDVILLDIVMPGIDGFAVCRELKADEYLRLIPVIFLTAFKTDRQSRVEALEAGAEGFLAKPLDEIELAAQIRAMAKIKAANQLQRQEKEHLAALVAERTSELEKGLAERLRVEVALKASEERFRGVFENATIGLYRTTPAGQIIMANPALVRMLGYSSFEELAQRDLSKEGFESEYPRSVFQQRIESEGQIIGLESAWLKRDGTTFFANENATVMRDEAGNILYYEGSVEDISARKRTEATWRALNAAAVALQRTAPREADIYQAAGTQLVALGLRCVVFTFDEATDSFVLKRLFLRAGLIPAIEKLTGLTTAGFQFPRRRVAVYDRVVENKEAVFAGDSFAQIVLKLLPQSLGRLAGRLKKLLGLASSILAPLQVEGRVAGILQVGAGWLSAADMPAITAFADQMSAALENARLYSQTQRRAAALATLNQVGQTINSTLEFDDLLETIYRQTMRVMDAINFYIALYDEQENEIHFKLAVEEGRRWEEVRRKFGNGLTEHLIFSGKPLLIADNVEETCQRLGIEPVGKPAMSWLGSPLIARGKVIGAIAVQSYEVEKAYDEEDLEFLSTLASHAAVAIDNVRLYEAERQRVQETAALLATAQAIASLRLDDVLETIASQAKMLFKADGSRIHLLEPDGETLRCVVALHERAEAALATLLKVGEGITGRVALQGVPEIVNQALADPDMKQMPGTPVEAETLVLAPLQVRGQVIGVMTVTRLGEERPFAPADLTFLTAFANQAAIAIDNARLYEETQRLAAFNQDIVQSMAEGIIVQDADGVCTFANPTAAAILGYVPDELVGLHWTAITPPDQQPIVQAADERRQRGESDSYELELIGKDGKKIVALVSGVPRLDRQGRFEGTMAVFTDITDRKRAEERLQTVARFSARATGEDFFPALVQSMALALDVKIVFAAELISTEPARAHALAIWVGEGLVENFDWLLARTPCAEVVQGKTKCFIKGLQATFPDDRWLVEVGAESYLGIPIRNNEGRVIGHIGVMDDKPFDDPQPIENLMEIFADRAGAELERAQAEEAMQKYARQLETLNTVTAALSTSLDLEHVLKLILDQIAKVLPLDSGAIFLYEKDGIRVVMDQGITPSIRGQIFSTEDELFEEIQKTGKPLVLNQVKDDPRFRNWGQSEKVTSWMGVPLIARDIMIGIMTLDSFHSNAYSSEQTEIILSFAAQAAQAIENARQFSTAQLRMERLAALRKIDQAIINSFDLKVTLGVLLDHLLMQLKVDAAVVLLYDDTLQSLSYAHGQGFHTPALQYTNLQLGQGLAGKAALQRRPIIIADLSQTEADISESPRLKEEGFVSYYGVPLLAKGVLVGVLEMFHRSALDMNDEWEDYLQSLVGQTAIAIDNIKLFDGLQRSNFDLVTAYEATIEGWSRAMELRDKETEGHSLRVTEMTIRLAQAMNIGKAELMHIRRGAMLHDIGKMGVPDEILRKSGPLTDEEWAVMRQHPKFANDMLSPITYLHPAIDIPYCHHEKWDGTGYPRGLKGKQIPLAACIFAVVDVWDALVSDRPYRKAWTQKKAIAYIREQSGKHFDPQVVDAFLAMMKKKSYK